MCLHFLESVCGLILHDLYAEDDYVLDEVYDFNTHVRLCMA